MAPPCLGLGDLFFSHRREDIDAARAICAGCPRRARCLADALDCRHAYPEGGGVWAGTTPAERRAFRDARITKRESRAEAG